MNTAIIVAAGSGTRLGSDIPKQFIEVNGKPVIRFSMERFDEAPSIDSIIVVVAPGEVDRFDALAAGFGIRKLKTVVAGGSSRADSVRRGLAAVEPATRIIAVHDGARPLVSVDEIERTIAAAQEVGAACLTAAVNDTIKVVESESITTTIDRRTLRRALTPQAFRIELLQKAFAQHGSDASVTDESSLVEKLGCVVKSVAGSTRNIKITYPEDLIFASAVLAIEDPESDV
jgi:2-C-methyl-D-erythritol 4-phosphate cytidylyltransferase